MEEDASNFTKTHFLQQHYNAEFQANPRKKGKTCSQFFLKLLFIALFCSVLPLFPSDPPEFISNTVFAKSWELIHLFVIGIALSYGLFCSRKTTQNPLKGQISQPYAPNILHHSSIFDYEEGNPCGVSDKNVIPTQSFNLSHYRTDPFLELRRERGKVFDEKPLGLPVRSLRSRIMDSDSEEEEVCASDSDSELSGNNSSGIMSRSEKDDNLEGNMGFAGPSNIRPAILCKSQSTRADFFMGGSGGFEATQLKSESFRSPLPEASSCQKLSGFCSWLPDSPYVEREQSWRGNQFYMPFSNYTQDNDCNLVGLSPNLETTTNLFTPSAAAVPSSVPFSGSDFASGSRTYNQGGEHWGSLDFEKGNFRAKNSGFFVSSPAVCSPMSSTASGLASRSRWYNHDSKNWGKSPISQYESLGVESANVFMPSAAFPPSIPLFADAFASSVKTSKIAELNHGSPLKKMDEMRSEDINMNWGGENTNTFLPSAAFSSSMPASAADVASSNSAKFSHGSSFKKKDEIRSENNNVALGGENANIFMPTHALSSSVPDPVDGCPASEKASKSEKFNHGSSLKKRDEMRTTCNTVAVGSFQKEGNSHCDPFSGGKSLNLENENLGSEKPNFFMKTADVLPSVPSFVNEFASLVKASTNPEFNHEAYVKKKEETSEKDDVSSIGKGNKTLKPHFVDPFSSPTTRVDVSPKNYEQRSIQERWDSDCFEIPSIENNNMGDRVDASPKKNEQRSIAERWDSGCFVLPSSEHNDMGDSLQESTSPLLADSSEASSSAGSSRRLSCHEQGSVRNKVEENVPWSAPMNNSETQNVIEDVPGENDSYKPSTPSPPLQIQTRKSNHLASSVESSSRDLGNQSILYDNDEDQGSPPTPERRKALSRVSHSRRFSCTSFFDRDLKKSFKGEAKEANRKTKGENQFARGGKCGWDCLKLDVKPTLNKGKSVRTIRPKQIAHDQQKNDHIELKLEENSEGLSVTSREDRKGEKPGTVVIKIGISEKRSSSNGRKGEKLQESGATTSIVVGLNSNGKAAGLNDDIKEEENDSEIDRKADEFIAKFKEQIRLQKVAPRIDSSRQHKKSLYQA